MRKTKIQTRPFDMANYLGSEEEVAEYLRQVLEDGDPAELAAALGDVKPVGDGVWEMREFFGPGWRMYYIKQGSTIVVMLGGGDKSSQEHDIQRAKTLAQELKDAQDENPDPPV